VPPFLRVIIALFASELLALTVVAGPDQLPSSGKEMKEVALQPPPVCSWRGFYIGSNAGGQVGHSKNHDVDGYNVVRGPGNSWGYSESGFSGGVEAGYNWQWRWLVFGPEVDGGFMNLHGHGVQPGSPAGDTHGESDSDFFTTFRGRVGIALDQWLIFGTGGAIGVHYTTRVIDPSNTPPAGPDLEDGRKTDFDWGYTVGGGIERAFGCHWSIKTEYLYFNLDSQPFNGQAVSLVTPGPATFNWRGETTGHIIRAGLNYRF
jgi:outer membrane immunogenic protein